MINSNVVSNVWSIAELLRGNYKQHEYGGVVLPFTLLRRLDAMLEPTKDRVLEELEKRKESAVPLDTFLMDLAGKKFYNTSPWNFRKLLGDPNKILEEFKKYYKTATLWEVSDPNVLNALMDKLDSMMLYTEDEVDSLVKSYMNPREDQAALTAIIDPVAKRIRKERAQAKINDNGMRVKEVDLFIGDMGKFVRNYDFLSQIVDYNGAELEKRSIFYRCLLPKLKGEFLDEEIDLSRVIMTHYNLSKKDTKDLGLEKEGGEGGKLRPVLSVGSGLAKESDKAYLSDLIKELNELFEGELTDNDVINYTNSIKDKVLESETLKRQVLVNTKDHLIISPDFESEFTKAVIGQMGINKSLSEQILNDTDKRKRFSRLVVDLIYKTLSNNDGDSNETA